MMTKKDITNISKKLSSKTRLKILEILDDEKLSVNEIREIYEQKYKDIRRESIYRELEKLRASKLVNREYDDENKNFVYQLGYDVLNIDLKNMQIELKNLIE